MVRRKKTSRPRSQRRLVVAKRVPERQELTRLGKALRALGGIGGGAAGAFIGQQQAGSSLGTGLGATISKWLGSGEYSVGSNSIVSMHGSTSIPSMHKNDQAVTIRHKEFIGTIKGSIDFTTGLELPINPGMSLTFPWLSGIAGKFQQYRIKGMVYHYVPSSGTAISGTNPSLGTVMIQTTYRATDSAPLSKTELLNEYWSTEAVPTESFAHPVECNPNENPFNIQYVRSKTLSATDMRLMYDLGTTFVATQGQLADGNTLGDLWVTYEIELKKPMISSSATDLSQWARALYSAGGTGSTLLNGAYTRTGALEFTSTGNTVTMPLGSYGIYFVELVCWRNAGTFTAHDMSGTLTTVNSTQVTSYSGNGDSYNRSVHTTGGTTNMAFYTTWLSIPSSTDVATFTFPACTFSSNPDRCELRVHRFEDSSTV